MTYTGLERSLCGKVIMLERALATARFAIQVALDGGAVSERNVRSTLNTIDHALACSDPKSPDPEWCYTCDRPKNDCGCVENGGNY